VAVRGFFFLLSATGFPLPVLPAATGFLADLFMLLFFFSSVPEGRSALCPSDPAL
jgi:hypothetical protein